MTSANNNLKAPFPYFGGKSSAAKYLWQVFYNENDAFASKWLLNLINAGHIDDGIVDTRSIEDVQPAELEGFRQCHFFAGVGGWSYALRLAGWPDEWPVWTGSCPCQPFSLAGKRKGIRDKRHLWPAWFRLIEQCKPPVIFGEQVASKDGYAWLDIVQSDLEAAGYSVGAVVLPAAGFGAPHARHRIYFVADSNEQRPQGWVSNGLCQRPNERLAGEGGASCRMADYDSQQFDRAGGVGEERRDEYSNRRPAGNPGPTNSFWRDSDWIFCRDGKWRPVEPGTFPLVGWISSRVGRLRAYGNAIVPQVAAGFITAYLEWVFGKGD